MTTRRAGFTLIEILVAVMLTGLVALLAHQLFTAATEGGRRLHQAWLALDRTSNGRRWLRSAFLSLDVGLEEAGSFEGHPDRVQFSSWLLTPDGWPERRRLELGLDGGQWTAQVPPEPAVILADSVGSVAFDYLLEPGADTKWVREWVSAVSAPLAVRARVRDLRGRVDTVLYLIKARG